MILFLPGFIIGFLIVGAFIALREIEMIKRMIASREGDTNQGARGDG